ncbi:M1 family metallopeptidase [Nocardioides sp. LHG3406-4]|uniref:M1 family metallopeptidase n=1 Tax=Nocardioides sp. LHG3406-4 TaxID=2804575 RepID=UPI003CED7AE9
MRTTPAALAVVLLLATGCSGDGSEPDDSDGGRPAGGSPTAAPQPADPAAAAADLDAARSTPVEDSVYPDAGDPGVDALHYDLELAWSPTRRRLDGTATITLRATTDAPRLQLDLGPSLKPRSVTLDGADVPFSHPGKDLVVDAPVTGDQQYELVVTYRGEPAPVPAPTRRADFSVTGMTVTDAGELWTMQEPFGAYTWYPVNDQPADKALYDFTITTDAPFTGVANGELVESVTDKGRTTTRWHLDTPASSYLTTMAVGDYQHSADTTSSGLTIDYWYPRGLPEALPLLRKAPHAVDWVEERLGPYPFSTLGLVVTDAVSAMETQTMVTLGTGDYVLSEPVIMHEIAHQWYGDIVSPSDWRDVWLNEGMTMYLQAGYEADLAGVPVAEELADYAGACRASLPGDGPPGAYNAAGFGASNIYYCPALMWDELRKRVGEDEFWAVARSWLDDNAGTSAGREQLYDHWERATGLELSSFFDSWIMGRTMPEPTAG